MLEPMRGGRSALAAKSRSHYKGPRDIGVTVKRRAEAPRTKLPRYLAIEYLRLCLMGTEWHERIGEKSCAAEVNY